MEEKTADNQLLRRYVDEHSEAAFADLVLRHLDLVYSAALRQVGGDVHRAHDVAQTVFTVLARKASSVARHPVLIGWLYTTTQHAAAKVRRSEARRHTRELAAHLMHEQTSPAAPDVDWERLRPVLDEAMRELNDRDREAVLLRFFAQRPFAEIGTALNLSEDAARMRVERALEKLQVLLSRRGITSTAGALTAVLANQAVATAPVGLSASIAGTALTSAAAGEIGAVAALIAFMSATKTTVTLGVAAALAVATAVYQSSEARTTVAALANASRDHAAARDRLAELETKTRAAEQALADREQIRTQLAATNAAAAASKASAAAAAAKAEAEQQKALQQFLDNHPQLRMLKAEASRAYKQACKWPVFLGLGMTPEQAERANIITEETYTRRKAQLDAGLKLPPPDQAPLRAAFGDAAAERMIEFNKVRWGEGAIVSDLFAANYHTDEPFTAHQTKRLLEIVKNAQTGNTGSHWSRYDWDRIVAEAAPILSPAQLQVLRAKAAQARISVQYAAAAKEATAAAKK